MKTIPVILFGTGGVGRALLRQLIASEKHIQERSGLRFEVVAVADSQRWLFDPAGLTAAKLHSIEQAKGQGDPLPGGKPRPDSLLAETDVAGVRNAIVVDVTAADGMERVYQQALDFGYGVVMANKKVLAGPWSSAAQFYNHPAVRHESTVGGGQPVIATARYLADINDHIYAIEGQLSGTLGYLCQQLDHDVPFSQAVAEAKKRGYTEPDPREDLGGQDVMRKLLILARLAGWPLEAADIRVESLYPASLENSSVTEFMGQISAVDEQMATRIAEAKADGQTLRYIGRITPEGGQVGLLPIAADSPLGGLKYISFHTALYDDDQLMICGKGAGVEMTAGGVLGDMIAVAREVF
ncbi:MAG: hypothetical protein QNJ45_14800 [Ardenticatenaceae bacterium]|nr:hypothetical protein [Ardenticatenaceae bacterium]